MMLTLMTWMAWSSKIVGIIVAILLRVLHVFNRFYLKVFLFDDYVNGHKYCIVIDFLTFYSC